MDKTNSLDAQVKGYFTARHKNGVYGLTLLVRCIDGLAKSRDWDALSRFVSLSKGSGQEAKVKMIIRAAFGNRLTYKSCSKHDTGGRFTIGWEGSFDLDSSNTFGIIRKAVRDGVSWDDKAFNAELKKMFGPAKVERKATAEATAKAAKHIASYLKKLEADGFNVGEVLRLMEKERAIQSMPVGTVVKTVVNGAEVYEPEF